MHLRRLIVLIINARNIINLPWLLSSRKGLRRRDDLPKHLCSGFDRSDQKKPIFTHSAVPPRGCRVKQTAMCLFTMSKDPVMDTKQRQHNQTCSLEFTRPSASRLLPFEHSSHGLLTSNPSTGRICPSGRIEVVEPSGIEPLTSCLQSRRSPS